ncbi:MAG: hydroxymethylbilane synthase [Thermoplasmata archaeon]|uniref:Hydroxymethylbilane synthase n=1 Tax=Candidatus Sysuiplasma superficiale TaxID=2823368 RepID=A0A8J8CFC0_9ARCH|nr:hydroxymethylbilane synthase [Candidatus Sysuiplasma superficiale]
MILVASRKSELARIQAEMAIAALSGAGMGERMQLRTVSTSGDSGKGPFNPAVGSFVDRINELVSSGEMDIGVHSMKDLPPELPAGLEISAVLERGSRFDCVLGPSMLARLPTGSTVGTSSARRRAQALHMRPDLKTVAVRGNVGTRASLVRPGGVDAVILAMAGLERLTFVPPEGYGLYPLPVDYFVPSAGQGAIAIVSRKGFIESEVARRASHPESRSEVEIERRILSLLSGGCNSPIGITAISFGRGYTVRIQKLSPDGRIEARITESIRSLDDAERVVSDFNAVEKVKFGD